MARIAIQRMMRRRRSHGDSASVGSSSNSRSSIGSSSIPASLSRPSDRLPFPSPAPGKVRYVARDPRSMPAASSSPALKRRIALPGAIGIGLASMIGAGVFAVWGPAAAAAGDGLLIALALAAIVATLNAFSSAQLAMAHPVAGGAYSFGRRWVGPWTGFAAGWLFVTGKTASAAAIASIAAVYLWPAAPTPVAVGLIVLFAALNMSGVRTTARVSRSRS